MKEFNDRQTQKNHCHRQSKIELDKPHPIRIGLSGRSN